MERSPYSISLSDFTFKPSGYGHYFVEYTSPSTSKKHSCITNDMRLIDATKNAERVKKVDLIKLKRLCKKY